jgi:hypothetical protein
MSILVAGFNVASPVNALPKSDNRHVFLPLGISREELQTVALLGNNCELGQRTNFALLFDIAGFFQPLAKSSYIV